MEPDQTLAGKAQIILDKVRAVFQEADVALPSRQYLAVGGRGETEHSCEQLTVAWEMSYTGTPGAPAQTPQLCNVPTSASFIVELVRKFPVSKNGVSVVNQDLLTASAVERMQDAELLIGSAKEAIAATWFEKGLFDLSAGSPQGELQALVLTIIVVV